KKLKNIVKDIITERLITYLIIKNNIDETKKAAKISKEIISIIIQDIKHFTFQVHGSLPIEKAIVTGGGVSIKEIAPNTMQSKKMHGLYFCGEILDIHGYAGGYSITTALVTGRLGGSNASIEKKENTVYLSLTFDF